MWSIGCLTSRIRDGKNEAGAKLGDYFDFAEALTKLPSHPIPASFRGEKEVLDLAIEPESTTTTQTGSSPYELRIMRRFAIWRPRSSRQPMAHRDGALGLAHQDFGPSLRRPAAGNVAEQEAVRVFAANLRD